MLNNQRLRHDGRGGVDFPIENCKGVPVFFGSKISCDTGLNGGRNIVSQNDFNVMRLIEITVC